MRHLDPALLRTFLAFADKGSLALAAAEVGRTPSAVTAQMQRLEAALGAPLLAEAGRGRVLTPAGEELVPLARRILAAEREAWLAVRGSGAAGQIRFGATQDFAEGVLTPLLRSFAEHYGRVRLELRIGRSGELTTAFDRSDLDLVLTLAQEGESDVVNVAREPMIWVGAPEFAVPEDVPLALLDPPCGFRAAALAAFETSGRRHHIAATSASLAGLTPAIAAGLAVSARTRHVLRRGIVRVEGLPPLPEARFSLRMRPSAGRAVQDFAALLTAAL